MSLKSKIFGNSFQKDPTLRLFSTLTSMGLSPSHIVDIGGNRGDWTRRALRAFPDAHITVFEPQTSLRGHHADLAIMSNVELVYAGVGGHDGTGIFTHHDRDDSSSFLYSAAQAKEKGFAREEIQIFRLDTFIGKSPFGAPQIVKIDAEGFDLQVLEGARETLSAAEVVLIEAAVANPEYPSTVLRVLQEAENLELKLFDITDLNRAPKYGALWLLELVLVKRGGQLDQAAWVYA